MPARILYAGQQVSITPNGGGAAGTLSGTRYLPVQSAGCDENSPTESILSLGHLGSLARVQNAASTCKSSIKTYIPNSTGLTGSSNYQNLINTDFLNILTGQALAGLPSTIVVSPNGFTMSGILSDLNIEISNGSFATADFSFEGVGKPLFASAPAGSTFSEQSNMPSSFSPVTSTNVGGSATGLGCSNSFKFNLSMPTETISCLGGQISGVQSASFASNFLQVSKPPFSTKISLEGLAIDAPTAGQLTSAFTVGKLSITLPNGVLESQSTNQSVGSAGQTRNIEISDTSCAFADIA